MILLSSPFIVFDDAKIETAIEACILAKFRNSGQTCVTANRIFVQDKIYDQFAQALTEKIKTLQVGNGVDDGTFVGPLTHDRAVEKALRHIDGKQAFLRPVDIYH
jgi:succinate-semialdehyde dehydrogenase/glutarate-semialdehyde dehydrogenase